MWRVTAVIALLFSGYAGAQSLLTERLRVTRGNSNVREEPSTSAEVIALVTRENDVLVDSAGPTWSRVRLPDGTHGYIASRLLAPSPQPGEWRTLLYFSTAGCIAAVAGAVASRRRRRADASGPPPAETSATA